MNSGEKSIPKNLAAMSIGNTVVTSVNSLWIMFMPYFFLDLGLQPFTIGIFFSLFAVSRAAMSLIGGNAADTYGRKRVIALGYSMYSMGPLIILASVLLASDSMVSTASLALIGFTCLSAGGGLAGPACSVLVVESSPENRKGLSYMISMRVLPSIPPAVLIILGGILYESDMFWFALTLGFMGVALVAGFFALVLEETFDGQATTARKRMSVRDIRGDWILLLIIAAFIFDGVSSRGLSWYVPVFVGRSNLGLYSVMISVSTLVIALAALVSGALVDRVGARSAIVGAWLLLAVTVVLFPHATDPIAILFLYSIWVGLDMVDVSIPPIIIAQEYPKEKRASIMGAFSTSVTITSIAGPALISGALLLGDNVPFYLKAVMNLIGVGLFFWATKGFRMNAGTLEVDSPQEQETERTD